MTTSKDIKSVLKDKFPATKFSVRQRHYGYFVVSWNDGPSENEVYMETVHLQETRTDHATGEILTGGVFIEHRRTGETPSATALTVIQG